VGASLRIGDRHAGGARADALARLDAECKGSAAPLTAPGLTGLRQVACGGGGPRRFGLSAERNGRVAVGSAYPADWAPLLNAASVLLGATRATAIAQSAAPTGLRELQAVFPDGPPGQGASVNYDLLRRRAYERNVTWSFGAAERDFAELLRVHRSVAPGDLAGEAEIWPRSG
jgi:hypothetical protein